MAKKTAPESTPAPKRMQITQLRRAIDTKQRLALQGLGLRRIRHVVDVVDTPSTRGLVLKVRHLVVVEEVGTHGTR
jgi:large subunit ribosomal protein L30